MTTKAPSYIDVTAQARQQLAKIFNCTEKMVWHALTYNKDTELARKIRFTAVRNYGGKPMRHCPDCETLHEVREGGREFMRQNFDNGVTLEWEKHTPNVVLYKRGKELKRYQCMSMEQFSEIQLEAETL